MRSGLLIKTVFVLFLFTAASTLQAEVSWELEKDEDGIQIYVRELPGYPIKEFKGVVVLEHTIEKVSAVIGNVQRYPQWVDNCIEGAIIDKIDTDKQIAYMVIQTPWPVNNRDCFFYAELHVRDEGREFLFKVKALPDYSEKKDGLVRMPLMNGYYQLAKLNDGKTRLTFQLLSDPGGFIPDWITNLMIVNTPYNSLVNLRKYLAGL